MNTFAFYSQEILFKQRNPDLFSLFQDSYNVRNITIIKDLYKSHVYYREIYGVDRNLLKGIDIISQSMVNGE